MTRHKLAGLALATGLCLVQCSFVAVMADEVQSVIRKEVVSDGVTTTETTTTSTSTAPATIEGTVVTTVEPKTLLYTIDERRSALERLIDAELLKGHINAAVAQDLRNELIRVKTMQALEGRPMTYLNLVPLAADLDIVVTRLRTQSPAVELTPLVSSKRIIISNTLFVPLDDLLIRRIELEEKIVTSLMGGKITNDQASLLRAQLDTIARTEASMLSDSNIDHKESRVLYKEFDRVGSKLDSYIASTGGSL